MGASVVALLFVSAVFAAALVWYLLLAVAGRRPRSEEMRLRGETVFLPLFVREYWDWVIGPVSKLLIASKVHPNTITVTSLIFSAAAGVAFAFGWFGLGGWLYVLGGTCDMFDGKVARAHGIASKSGAFIDSTLDRYTEIFVLVGLAYYFRATPIQWAAIAALAGSLMVSYTRARGEGLGYSTREGGMQRAERIVYIGLAGVFGKVIEAAWPSRAWGEILLSVSLVLLAFSTNVSAIQRFVSIIRGLRSHERAEREGGSVVRHPVMRKASP